MIEEWLVVEAVVAVGALLQGAVGFGVALVAAPLLMLVRPDLVPAPMILAAWCLTLLIAVRDRRGVDWGGLRWTVPGLLAGTAAAVLLLQGLPEQGVGLMLGTVVLAAVGLSVVGWHPLPHGRNLVVAATAAGFMGTATSVGGPPMALVFQRESGVRLRGTLSAVFQVGGVVSLTGLALAGRFGPQEMMAGLGLLPGVVVGFGLSGRLAARLDGRRLRPAVLAVSAAAAMGVLIRYL
ncbi:sulfite exporter TauE/SafE family protein [Thiohalorhabdus sp.]|uniref:sulfite exporter TauE/SafE family protein n=1 Tax=Thiohalorhabdus sp. TaxID=3094134 RepID=UPI002FC2F4A1